MPYLIALDEGTTSARSVLYDEQGRAIAMESMPIDCIYPHPGWVEQDPEQIWSAQL
ncbi:MAG: glycerol kinase, partial [Bryobacterales bacterium]|nr:glycerol kinase [Bryobacterales bacterium]